MLDTETLRPVIIAMAMYIVISKVLPQLLKKPSGIKPLDEMNMMVISQQGFLMSGALLVGLIVYLTNYVNAELF